MGPVKAWQIFGCVLVLLLSSIAAYAEEGRNVALGAHYTFEPAARYDLTNDIGDATQLTDGRYVSGYFWGSREAVGWKAAGPIRVEIDLGEMHAINSVCINTARGNHAEVSFPERVELFTSPDRKQYNVIGDLYQGGSHPDGAYMVQRFCAVNLSSAGRYVLMVLQPSGRFTFLDEIEVLGSDGVAKDQAGYTQSLRRDEIGDFLKSKYTLLHRKEALVWQVAKLMASPEGASSAVQNKIKSFAVRLERERVTEPEALDHLQDELFALHRVSLADSFKEPLILWHKSPWAAFSPMDSPVPGTLIKSGLNFDLMRHGSGSNAFILTNNTDKQQNYKIAVELEGHSAAQPQLEIREVIPVIAASHETVGDALKPIENGNVSIKPGESRQVWLTAVADSVASGDYVGRLSIKNIDENYLTRELALHIKVWPAMFPERQHVFVNAWAYLNERPIAKFPHLAMRDLSVHHVNVSVLHPWQIPWPNFKAGGAGVVDYAKFDETLRYQKDAQKRLFYLAFNDEKSRTFGGKYEFMGATWQLVFKKWIKDWAAHLKAQGLGYRDFAFYPVDEPRKGDEIGYLVDTATLIKEVDPKLQVFTTIGEPVGGVDLFRLSQTVDIFQMNVRTFSGLQKTVLARLDKEIWSYSAFGGGKLGEPLGYYRMQAWNAFSNGLTGIGFWAYADIGPSGTAWDDFDGVCPDFAVIYESRNGPVSSKRWEAWREGVEDYELLMLARQKLKSGKESAEFDEMVSSVISNASDYRQFEMMRRYLLSTASR